MVKIKNVLGTDVVLVKITETRYPVADGEEVEIPIAEGEHLEVHPKTP